MNEVMEKMEFFDDEEKEQVLVIVRNAAGNIGLCLSRQHGADVEVMLTIEQSAQLVQAMQKVTTYIAETSSESGKETRILTTGFPPVFCPPAPFGGALPVGANLTLDRCYLRCFL